MPESSGGTWNGSSRVGQCCLGRSPAPPFKRSSAMTHWSTSRIPFAKTPFAALSRKADRGGRRARPLLRRTEGKSRGRQVASVISGSSPQNDRALRLPDLLHDEENDDCRGLSEPRIRRA